MTLIEREKCLRSLGVGIHAPAWSLIADELLVHVARGSGWDMSELCRLHLVDGNGVADDKGLELVAPDQFSVRAKGATYLATIMRGWLNGGMIGHPFKIRCGADGAVSYDGKRMPTITIMDQCLPDTLIAAAAGRAFDDIVAHPMLQGSDCTVSSLRNVTGNVPKIELRLRRKRVPLAPPPPGIDIPWLSTIAKLSA